MKLLHMLMLSSCVFFFNCSDDLAKEIFNKRTSIDVSASVEKLDMPFTTRTVTTGLNNGAFTVSETTALNKVLVHIGDDDHAYTFNDETGSTTELTADQVTYFPLNSTSVNVYGHYPYSEGFTTVEGQQYFTIQQNQTTDDGYLKSDLMTADNSPATRTLNGNGSWTVNKSAKLNFKHRMAKLILNVSTDESAEGGSGLTIKKVEVNGVKPRVPVTYDSETGEYGIGAATSAANGESYDLQVLDGPGTATVLIPSQRYNVEEGDPAVLTNFRKFITITVDVQYYNQVNELVTATDVELVYFFKGNGKFFKPGYVYNITLVPGKNDYNLKDEYNVPGVELAKWADDGESTSVHVNAAEEKLDIVAGLVQTSVAATAQSKVYTGHEHTLDTSTDELVVRLNEAHGSAKLVEGDDYELHYSNNVNVGQATVTIMGIGRYAGNLEQHFEITKKSINDESVSVTINNSIAYDGSSLQPTPTIHDSEADKDLTRYDYATSDWTNNSNAGTNSASVTITGTGNYKDSRTATFSIPKANGSVTFADEFDTSGSIPTLTLIKPKGHEFDYIDAFKDILGDGKLAAGGVVSSDNSVVEVTQVTPSNTPSENKWKFHVKKSGTVTLTFTMTNKTEGVSNYDYTGDNQPTCRVVITDGPALPIEYVGDHDLGQFGANYPADYKMSEDDKSEHSCWLTWWDSPTNGADNSYIKKLSRYGLTVNSVHHHLPSTNEWRSILPAVSYVTWCKTYLDAVETGIAFGVTTTQTSDIDDSDYTHHMTKDQTKGWTSDFYSPNIEYEPINSTYNKGAGTASRPSRRCYALRFKGTTYCSAWRYDWIWTTSDNTALTGNSVGRKSVVVRVIYLGPSFKYENDYTDLTDESKFNWDGAGVIKRSFPCIGTNAYVHQALDGEGPDRPEQTWYWSTTPTPDGDYFSCRLTHQFLQGDQHHIREGFNVRLFKDYVE